MQIVDLESAPQFAAGVRGFDDAVVVARCSDPAVLQSAAPWADAATLTLVNFVSDDPRVVTVDDIDTATAGITAQVAKFPLAAQICDDVLRANAETESLRAALTVESLAYSALQAGPEFARWLVTQPPRERHDASLPVRIERDEPQQRLSLTLNRPEKHNAFSNALRAGLLDGLEVAQLDDDVTECVFRGAGRSFCSGGDLKEFGLFDDVAASHIARTRFSPALALAAVTARLGRGFIAEVHGAVMGSGLEMAAYAGTVRSDATARFGLPELRLGLIPGAGGTVSVTRRIGRWRTAYLVLSGETVDPQTALQWGLVDEIVDTRFSVESPVCGPAGR